MPQVFKVGAYWVYFWANEGKPLEPIHVHIAEDVHARMQQKCGLLLQENVLL